MISSILSLNYNQMNVPLDRHCPNQMLQIWAMVDWGMKKEGKGLESTQKEGTERLQPPRPYVLEYISIFIRYRLTVQFSQSPHTDWFGNGLYTTLHTTEVHFLQYYYIFFKSDFKKLALIF